MCVGRTGEVANNVCDNGTLVIYVTLEDESPACNVTEMHKVL